MVPNPITTDTWIVRAQLTVAEMATKILICFETLKTCRRYMFIRWLQAHSNKVKHIVNVYGALTVWLESLQHENFQSEYRLIMDEICWWGSQDEQSLTKIALMDLARNGV